MAVLVVAEHDNEALNEATLKAVTAAQAMGGDIDILCAGNDCGSVAQAAAKIEGVRKVLCAKDPALGYFIAEAMEAVIVPLMDDYEAMVTPAGTVGKNFAPRVAARLDVMQLSDVTAVEDADTFVRPIYAGNAMMTVKSGDAKKIVTVRPTTFKAANAQGGSAEVEEISPDLGELKSEFVGEALSDSDRPELASAKIVISGGRGMGNGENFSLLDSIADRLGAAVGASRAAVDAGFVPNEYQVGQTGKVVAPDLYIAVGISGAIQHLAGMKDSKVIVAINKDEEAPIFQVADYGLVADLFDALPKFEEAIDKLGYKAG